jgi:hypothetical protein
MERARIASRIGALALQAFVLLVGACAPQPGASFETASAGVLSVQFSVRGVDREYAGFGTQAMIIHRSDLFPIGRASGADPSLFPNPVVHRLAGVSPADAIVLFERSAVTDEEYPVLFTHGGVSPPLVEGICRHYAQPAEFGCPTSTPR